MNHHLRPTRHPTRLLLITYPVDLSHFSVGRKEAVCSSTCTKVRFTQVFSGLFQCFSVSSSSLKEILFVNDSVTTVHSPVFFFTDEVKVVGWSGKDVVT